jgi:hypothetical protein
MCLHSTSRIAVTAALVGLAALGLALAAAGGAGLVTACPL